MECVILHVVRNRTQKKPIIISTLGIKIIEKCNVQFLNSDLRVSITKYAD